MKLSALQSEFQAHILYGEDQIHECIVNSGTLDHRSRMAIYANAYRSRLNEVLAKDFPAVKLWLSEAWDGLVNDYIDAHPSNSFTLRDFGARFPAFLAAQSLSEQGACLPDLARFEWAFCDAFDAPDHTALQPSDLAMIAADDWPGLSFVPVSSLQYLHSHYNLPALWRIQHEAVEEGVWQRSDEAILCLVWRKPDLASHFRCLSADEAEAFLLMVQGENFSTICAALLSWHEPEQVGLRAAGLLKTWITDGLINRYVIAD